MILGIEIELFGLKLVHYAILGAFLFVVSCVILVRREKVHVAEEVSMLLQCPRCKNQWQGPLSKTH
jgi:hypothetical protein